MKMGETTWGRTETWTKQLRAKRKEGETISGANGKVGETNGIQVKVDTKRVPEVTKLGTK